MNGREIANLIAVWADDNNVGARGLQAMSVTELMNVLSQDNKIKLEDDNMTSYENMLLGLDENVDNAKREIEEVGIIDGVFSHSLSDSITVSRVVNGEVEDDDVLVAICPYNRDYSDSEEEMCLGLFGIDTNGIVDLISVTTSATEYDLKFLYDEMKELQKIGYYTEATEWGIFG